MNKISIITVTYNASKHLRDCLDSVMQQDTDVEHILVDGVSTDDTLQIVDTYRSYLTHIISEKDNGMYDAINKGIRLSSCDVIGILNADDFYPSNDTLSKVVNAFVNLDIDAVYGDLVYVDKNNTNKIIRSWHSGYYHPNKFYWGWMPPHPAFFLRRRVYEEYGLFSLDLDTAADYELMLRMLLKYGVKANYIPTLLVKMRNGGMSNNSIRNRLKANRMDRKAWRVNELSPYPWTTWMKPLRKLSQWIV